MTDAQTLLARISAFRDRLQPLPGGSNVSGAELAADPATLNLALRTVAPVATTSTAPPLTARARRLLEDARGLIARQRELAGSPHLVSNPRPPQTAGGPPPKTLSDYHKATVAMIDAAMGVVQSLPHAAEGQLRLCAGLEVIFSGVRSRQDALDAALDRRGRVAARTNTLARKLADVAAYRLVDTEGFTDLAHDLLDEARQGMPLSFAPVNAGQSVAHAVAAHALAVAAVVARVAPHDFEWADQAEVAVAAALVMDVGMLSVPEDVYFASGDLDAAQRRELEGHTVTGSRLLARLYGDDSVIPVAAATHHERPDGTGYPAGRLDDGVPTLAKILNACDTYATLRTDRPGRPARDARMALMETLASAELGAHDRESAELLTNLGVYPVGTAVELSDGRVAVVAANHPHRANVRAASRPVLAIVTDADGRPLPHSEFLDLAATDRGSVARCLTRRATADLLAADFPEYAD
jgi:HD-GYP domain-containing protein (c-di-GMP phosphodiesterase class II)